MADLASDQLMLKIAGDLACSDHPPDLILTEFSATDTIPHYRGFDSGATQWAYQIADMAVGLLLHRLSVANRLDDYAVIIASDHGQAPIHTAIYPDSILPHERWTTKGATLQVHVRDENEAKEVEKRLANLYITRLSGHHLPDAVCERGIVMFCAPKGHAFERRPLRSTPSEATGPATIISTHGLTPGDPFDDDLYRRRWR